MIFTGRVNGSRRLPRISRDALVGSIVLGGVTRRRANRGVAAEKNNVNIKNLTEYFAETYMDSS